MGKIRITTRVKDEVLFALDGKNAGELIPLHTLFNPHESYTMSVYQAVDFNRPESSRTVSLSRGKEDFTNTLKLQPHNLEMILNTSEADDIILTKNLFSGDELPLLDRLNRAFFEGNIRLTFNYAERTNGSISSINTKFTSNRDICDMKIEGDFYPLISRKKPKKGANRLFLLYGTGKLTDPNTDELLEEYKGQGEVTYLTFDISKRIAEILKELIAEEKEIECAYGVMEMLLEEYPEVKNFAVCNMVILFIQRFNEQLKFVRENPTAPVSYIRGKRVIGIEPKSLLDDRGLTDQMKLLEAEEQLFRKEHYNI